MTNQQRSDAAHSVIEAAAGELRAIGMDGAAPWRMMAWNAFDRLRHEQCDTHGREDLLRLRGMLDKHLAEIAQ